MARRPAALPLRPPAHLPRVLLGTPRGPDSQHRRGQRRAAAASGAQLTTPPLHDRRRPIRRQRARAEPAPARFPSARAAVGSRAHAAAGARRAEFVREPGLPGSVTALARVRLTERGAAGRARRGPHGQGRTSKNNNTARASEHEQGAAEHADCTSDLPVHIHAARRGRTMLSAAVRQRPSCAPIQRKRHSAPLPPRAQVAQTAREQSASVCC